jgi:hypothetical protein
MRMALATKPVPRYDLELLLVHLLELLLGVHLLELLGVHLLELLGVHLLELLKVHRAAGAAGGTRAGAAGGAAAGVAPAGAAAGTGRAWWAADGAWSSCGRVERAAVRQRCPPRGTGLSPCNLQREVIAHTHTRVPEPEVLTAAASSGLFAIWKGE